MKNITFLLSIYILLLNFQPILSLLNISNKFENICFEKNNCDKKDNNSKSKDNTENRICNPFFNCSYCQGFYLTDFTLNIKFIDFEIASKIKYIEKLKSIFITDYFIPPKLYLV